MISIRSFLSYFLLPQPYLKPGEGPIVLVLAPTRELAVQIKEECKIAILFTSYHVIQESISHCPCYGFLSFPTQKTGDKFGGSSEIKNTVVYGGVPKHRQVRDLRSGIEIVIATPVRYYVRLDTPF